LVPVFVAYFPYFRRRNQANRLTVLHYQKAAARAMQEMLINEVAYAEITLHLHAVAFHHVRNTPVAQALNHPRLHITGAGRIQQEPAYECDPQAARVSPQEKQVQAIKDEQKCHNLADARGYPS